MEINGTEQYNYRRMCKEMAGTFASQNKIRAIDITREYVISKGLNNEQINQIMKGVCMWISEAYGIALCELYKSSKEELMSRYGIDEERLNILYDNGDIQGAYNAYVRSMVGEKGDGSMLSGIKPMYVPDEDKEKKIKEELYNTERERLEALLEIEEDSEKRELYEAQLKVLELKHKNG